MIGIGESVLQMREFVAALLGYSRAAQGFHPMESVPLAQPLEDAQAGLGPAIAAAGAVISHDPLPTVTADRSQVEQLFARLIDNALRYRGEAPPRIHISAARAESHWVVSVRDNGRGIEAAQLERVFHPFARRGDGPQAPGAGMGLAVCRKIVARHGGRMWAVSEGPGQGAMFCFTLPDTHPAG